MTIDGLYMPCIYIYANSDDNRLSTCKIIYISERYHVLFLFYTDLTFHNFIPCVP